MGAAQLAILGLVLLSLGLSGYALWRDEPPAWRFAVPEAVAARGAPRLEKVFDYRPTTGQAHSPAILMHEAGFSLAWFEGSQEAQADVDIHAARFTRGGGGWRHDQPAPLVTRGNLGAAMVPRQLVVTLGNTVENEAAQAGLFATVVSLGGWAMASVADVRLDGGGPVRARKLNLSPFLNRSHLVKSPMVDYADGSRALPAYFEMGAMHGVLVRFGPRGRVRDARRMLGQAALKPIQPMVVPLDAQRAVAFLRDFGDSGKLLVSRTADGGQSWSRAVATDVAHPSAPVAALPLGEGRILMAMNRLPGSGEGLHLAVSADEGESWRRLVTLEDDGGAARYPMLRRLPRGEILLSYSTDNKRGIRAWVFNDAWVAAQ